VSITTGYAVGRQVHVELEPVGAGRQPNIEGRQRVLRPERRPAAVREDARASTGEERHAV
jgi:hypothetical protein